MSRRTAGSVRFDPYWKVQWWDDTSLAWRDIQEAIHDEDIAIVSARAEARHRETKTRLMRITETGRAPTHEVAWPPEGPLVTDPALAPHEGRSSAMIPTRPLDQDDPAYCRRHDLFDCPYAHDPREETAT